MDALAVTHLDAPPRCRGLRICHGYAMEGQLVERLPVPPPGDLAAQEALTGRLLAARPALWSTPEHWPEAISGLLGAPVVLESCGPARQRFTRAPSDRVRP